MSGIYGRAFAAVYNELWRSFSAAMWPHLRKLAERPAPGERRWLDLCCGTGALLEHVIEAGYEAVGLDASSHQLAYARRNVPAARFVRADVRDFCLGRTFGVVTCMYDSLNYLTSGRDLERAFRCARRHLGAGGLFVFDMNTFAGLQANWCRTSASHTPRRTLIITSSFDETRAIGRCLITGFIRTGRLFEKFEEEHVQRGYRPGEIEQRLVRAGLRFRKYDVRGGLAALARPRKHTGRLLYVCRRS